MNWFKKLFLNKDNYIREINTAQLMKYCQENLYSDDFVKFMKDNRIHFTYYTYTDRTVVSFLSSNNIYIKFYVYRGVNEKHLEIWANKENINIFKYWEQNISSYRDEIEYELHGDFDKYIKDFLKQINSVIDIYIKRRDDKRKLEIADNIKKLNRIFEYFK